MASKFGSVLNWIFNPVGAAASTIASKSGNTKASNAINWVTNPFGQVMSGLVNGDWSGSDSTFLGSFVNNSTLNDFLNDPLNQENVKFNQSLATRQQDFYEQLSQQQMDFQRESFDYQKQYDEWAKSFAEDSYYNNYQNTVSDMQKAGLNPLALGGTSPGSASIASSSASQGSGASPQAPGSVNGSNLAGSLFSLIGSIASGKISSDAQIKNADLAAGTSLATTAASNDTQKYAVDNQTLIALKQLALEEKKVGKSSEMTDKQIEKLDEDIYRQRQISNYTDQSGNIDQPNSIPGAILGAGRSFGSFIKRGVRKYVEPTNGKADYTYGSQDHGYIQWLGTGASRSWHKRTNSLPYSEDSYNYYKESYKGRR